MRPPTKIVETTSIERCTSGFSYQRKLSSDEVISSSSMVGTSTTTVVSQKCGQTRRAERRRLAHARRSSITTIGPTIAKRTMSTNPGTRRSTSPRRIRAVAKVAARMRRSVGSSRTMRSSGASSWPC